MRSRGVGVVIALAVCGVTPTAAQTVEYFHLDAVGSVRAVTDQTGAVVRRHDYGPFGTEEALCLASGSDARRFTGQVRDWESCLDYFGARYYASQTGRFTTVDPALNIEAALIDPQRWNRYTYALNNPLKFTDPDGRDPRIIGGAIGAGVYAAWTAYQNVQQGRSWYDNIGFEASKGFLIGATLGLAAPAIAGTTAAEMGVLTSTGATAATTFGFTRVEGVIEGFTYGKFANGAEVAARFSRSGDTLTTSVLGAFNAEGARAAGTLNAILQGAQTVAKDQGARQLVIQAVGVVNKRLADLLIRQGFTQTTIRVGKETITAYEKIYEVY